MFYRIKDRELFDRMSNRVCDDDVVLIKRGRYVGFLSDWAAWHLAPALGQRFCTSVRNQVHAADRRASRYVSGDAALHRSLFAEYKRQEAAFVEVSE